MGKLMGGVGRRGMGGVSMRMVGVDPRPSDLCILMEGLVRNDNMGYLIHNTLVKLLRSAGFGGCDHRVVKFVFSTS